MFGHQYDYFRQYKRDIITEIFDQPGMSHETLDNNDKVMFHKPSMHRQFPIRARTAQYEIVFYTNKEDLRQLGQILLNRIKTTKDKNNFSWIEDVPIKDFAAILRATCPYRMGLYPEEVNYANLRCLCELARKYAVTKLARSCRLFVKEKYQSFTTGQLIEVFDLLRETEIDYINYGSKSLCVTLAKSIIVRDDILKFIGSPSCRNSNIWKTLIVKRNSQGLHHCIDRAGLREYIGDCESCKQSCAAGFGCIRCGGRFCLGCIRHFCDNHIAKTLNILLADNQETQLQHSPDSGISVGSELTRDHPVWELEEHVRIPCNLIKNR